jgi:heptosyltransferase-1
MRVLIVKTSSLGDIIHTLPALTDAGHAMSDITFDWVVEENFAEIPSWHPLVKKVIPVALRRWRKHWMSIKTWREWCAFRTALRATQYDVVIDAQGLLKSVFISLSARGKRVGFNAKSAREPLAALLYQQTYLVAKKQHAISRVRHLLSQVLGYPRPMDTPDYGIDRARFEEQQDENYFVFLHGTTWETKLWPESSWIELANIATDKGYSIKLPWGNSVEHERALRIAAVSPRISVLPRLDLLGMAKVLANAKGVVAVDTGLLHLAAALNVPSVSLYGPTNPALTGALGKTQKHLSVKFSCAPCLSRHCIHQPQSVSSSYPPCFATLPPVLVWAELLKLL